MPLKMEMGNLPERDMETSDDVCRRLYLLRWPETDGRPVCPHCSAVQVYNIRRKTGAERLRCASCKRDFSMTTGTTLSHSKIPDEKLLALFDADWENMSASAIAREVGVNFRTALNFRNTMADE